MEESGCTIDTGASVNARNKKRNPVVDNKLARMNQRIFSNVRGIVFHFLVNRIAKRMVKNAAVKETANPDKGVLDCSNPKRVIGAATPIHVEPATAITTYFGFTFATS